MQEKKKKTVNLRFFSTPDSGEVDLLQTGKENSANYCMFKKKREMKTKCCDMIAGGGGWE